MNKKKFTDIKPDIDFVRNEEEILKFWKDNEIFKKSLEAREKAERFVFYEGPPTANGRPGAHHVLARSFKDIICRYKSMRGYLVERKAGWDTHGLPVELEVEKELGISGKPDIEKFGIAKFNEKCKKSVMRYTEEWEKLTERIGFWIDMSRPYVTYENEYIESIWWTIKQLWDKGLVYEGYKVVPHCPRCGTSLSSHEVAQGYKWVTEKSIYVKFRSKEHPDTFFLAWTTTPWTLVANVALAVSSNVEYVIARNINGEKFIVAEALVEEVLGEGAEIVKTFLGKELEGNAYEPLFDFPSKTIIEDNSGKYFKFKDRDLTITLADFVTLNEGTGIVHIAPAYGEDDLNVAIKYGLSIFHPVNQEGKYESAVYKWPDLFVKDADPLIVDELKAEGKLYGTVPYEHSYPFCWRCDTPLLYFAKSSWFIRTTEFKERFIKLNEKINWEPDHIKEGRFGNWLESLVDWSLSRERYWGTPLPVWRCQTGKNQKCEDIIIGSIEELENLSGQKITDLHRPYVDEIKIKCSDCGGEMKRIPEVIDVWFDSGAMPQAQWHYPFENKEKFEQNFPADYICEAIDQTRGWFFSLHAIAGMIFDEVAYRNVICLGHILDEKGEKMSKHKGNVVEPWTILNHEGADAFRWHLFTVSPPGSPKKFSEDGVKEVLRKFILTLWNTYSFFITYANIDGFDPEAEKIERKERSLLDRWILSKLETLVESVGRQLDDYQIMQPAREIANFVDDLSNWYVRRSRRRFWKSEEDKDKLSAYHTLYEALVTLSGLVAPFAPFISETIYQNLVGNIDEHANPSVHMTGFPEPDLAAKDEQIEFHMDTVRQIVTLGRSARFRSKVKIRQPLPEMFVFTPGVEYDEAAEKFKNQILEELNVKEMKVVSSEEAFLDYKVKPNLPVVGPKYGKTAAEIARQLSAADGRAVREAVDSGQPHELVINGEKISLSKDELIFDEVEPEGLVVESDRGFKVALSLSVTPGLKREGISREFVHFVQALRKEAGFNISDNIKMSVAAEHEFNDVLDEFKDYIKTETLATDILIGKEIEGHSKDEELDGFKLKVTISKQK